MMDSDDSDFYIGENSPSHDSKTPQVISQNLQTNEIRLNEHEDQEIENPSVINRDCGLEQTRIDRRNCKILKITGQCNKYLTLHFEINKTFYFYSIHGMRADHKMVLRCTKFRMKSKSKCGNLSFISVSEFLQQVITDKPNRVENSLMWTKMTLDYSDPRVYDTKNYFVNSFEIGKGSVLKRDREQNVS